MLWCWNDNDKLIKRQNYILCQFLKWQKYKVVKCYDKIFKYYVKRCKSWRICFFLSLLFSGFAHIFSSHVFVCICACFAFFCTLFVIILYANLSGSKFCLCFFAGLTISYCLPGDVQILKGHRKKIKCWLSIC